MFEIRIKNDPPGDYEFNLKYLQSISLQNVPTKSIFIMKAYLSVDWLRFYYFFNFIILFQIF